MHILRFKYAYWENYSYKWEIKGDEKEGRQDEVNKKKTDEERRDERRKKSDTDNMVNRRKKVRENEAWEYQTAKINGEDEKKGDWEER